LRGVDEHETISAGNKLAIIGIKAATVVTDSITPLSEVAAQLYCIKSLYEVYSPAMVPVCVKI